MTHTQEGALLPLLALVQCATLIDHLAATGVVDREALAHAVDCLFGRRAPGNPDSPADYAIGRGVLEDLLRGQLPENQRKIPAYVRGLRRLAGKLADRPALRSQLRERLAEASGRQREFGPEGARIHAVLGGIYADTLGQLKPSLSVIGSRRQICDRDNADLIRTLILGGVQAALAWQRAGGRWWLVALRKRAILRELERLGRG